MSRYYSGAYDRLDDDHDTWNPETSPSASNVNLASYEPYRSHAVDDDAPLNQEAPRTAYQQPGPSSYLNSKYPQRGIKGLKTKHWDSASRRKKIILISSVVAILIIIIAVVVGVSVAETEDSFSYKQSFVKVTNGAAFDSGGAVRDVPQSNHDGIGAGTDVYNYYQGDESNFPPASEWISFQQMWTNNRPTIEGACSTLDDGSDDTPEEIGFIFDAIKNRSTVSLVDHRFILAVILQESQGCVHVGQTTSSTGVSNPGLMQSHNGHSFDSSQAELSILAMVQDGVQGTKDGPGLVQLLNTYGNPYKAARGYNSGFIPANGDLSAEAGATACYVSDIANRLTGWVTAPNECPQEKGS